MRKRDFKQLLKPGGYCVNLFQSLGESSKKFLVPLLLCMNCEASMYLVTFFFCMTLSVASFHLSSQYTFNMMRLDIFFILVNISWVFSSVSGDVDGLCVTLNCGIQSTACFLESECAKVCFITYCQSRPSASSLLTMRLCRLSI